MYLIKNIIRSVKRQKGDKLRVITFCEGEEKYHHALAKTGHEFYLWNENIASNWNNLVEEKPSNVINLHNSSASIYSNYFDLVICHNRIEQYNVGSSVANALHIPLVIVDHCGEAIIKPSPIFANVSTEDITKLYEHEFVVNVCADSSIISQWPHPSKGSVIITPPVDTQKYRPLGLEKNFNLVLDNFIPEQVARFLSPLNKYTIIPTDREEDKTHLYNQGNVFVNTWKQINIKLLEAMSCGIIPISLETPEIGQVIKNNETGFIAKDVEHMITIIEKIKNKEIPNLQEISQNARDYVVEYHNINTFISKWEQVFELVHTSFYSRGM